jgi:hypothetical protein
MLATHAQNIDNYRAPWEVLEFASGSWAKSELAWIPHIRCRTRNSTLRLFGTLLKSAAPCSSRRQMSLVWEQDRDCSLNAAKTLTAVPLQPRVPHESLKYNA